VNKVTVLDGGMGQELMRRSGKSPTAMWSAQVMLDAPDLVQGLHVDFIRAGASVITINAYSATPERLARDSTVDYFEPLQRAAINAAIQAREQCGIESVRVAGCLPPLVGSYHPEAGLDYEKSLSTYQSIVALQAPHVDLILCETMASVSESRSSATAAKESGLPVWTGLTLDDENPACLRSGEPWQLAVEVLESIGVDAILINCSKPESISAVWSDFKALNQMPVGAYANGFTSVDALNPGGTVSLLQAREDLGPDAYADVALEWVAGGAAIIGGCCEVGPEHIACLSNRLDALGYQR
jgi:homocysteine S-methyltransferase